MLVKLQFKTQNVCMSHVLKYICELDVLAKQVECNQFIWYNELESDLYYICNKRNIYIVKVCLKAHLVVFTRYVVL